MMPITHIPPAPSNFFCQYSSFLYVQTNVEIRIRNRVEHHTFHFLFSFFFQRKLRSNQGICQTSYMPLVWMVQSTEIPKSDRACFTIYVKELSHIERTQMKAKENRSFLFLITFPSDRIIWKRSGKWAHQTSCICIRETNKKTWLCRTKHC